MYIYGHNISRKKLDLLHKLIMLFIWQYCTNTLSCACYCRIGRRWTSFLALAMCLTGGLIVVIIQYVGNHVWNYGFRCQRKCKFDGLNGLWSSVFLVYLLFIYFNIHTFAKECWGQWVINYVISVVFNSFIFITCILTCKDPPNSGGLRTGFALLASAGVDGAWGPIQTLTVELYPTAVR